MFKHSLKLLVIIIAISAKVYAEKPASQIIEFPNAPEIPVPKGMGYDGFFQAHQPVKLVFGVSDPKAQLKESLVNAAYTIKYLKPRGIPYKIQIVLYGKAVLAASAFSDVYSGYSETFKALQKAGVEFTICNNSLHSLQVDAEDLYPYMKVIPAGILQLVKKQMQGYAYISNQ